MDEITIVAFIRARQHADRGISFFITRLTNTAKALGPILIADLVNAKEVERIGLVNKVIP